MTYPSSPGWKVTGPSQAAALAVASHAKTVRDRVRFFLMDAYPLAFTADEIAEKLGESILTIRPRISELNKSDEIEAVSERRKNVSGLSATCWRIKEGA